MLFFIDDPDALGASVPATEPVEDSSSADQLRVDEFDAVMQELLPSVQKLWPRLSPVDALRAAANLAEIRLKEGGILTREAAQPKNAQTAA